MGYDRLLEHIATGLSPQDVQLNTKVVEIDWSKDTEVAVTTEAGDTIKAATAIITFSVGMLQSKQVKFKPALPQPKREAIRHLRIGPVSKMIMEFEDDFWPDNMPILAKPEGPPVNNVRPDGKVRTYWPNFFQILGRPRVLTAYMTGPTAAAMDALPNAQRLSVIRDDLADMFSASRQVALKSHRYISWGADPLALGGYSYLRKGYSGERAKLRASNTKAMFWAGEATAETIGAIMPATVHGAYHSGLIASGEVIRWLDS
jgi:monoamine oxidase